MNFILLNMQLQEATAVQMVESKCRRVAVEGTLVVEQGTFVCPCSFLYS